jgi:hypothetical protein
MADAWSQAAGMLALDEEHWVSLNRAKGCGAGARGEYLYIWQRDGALACPFGLVGHEVQNSRRADGAAGAEARIVDSEGHGSCVYQLSQPSGCVTTNKRDRTGAVRDDAVVPWEVGTDGGRRPNVMACAGCH